MSNDIDSAYFSTYLPTIKYLVKEINVSLTQQISLIGQLSFRDFLRNVQKNTL